MEKTNMKNDHAHISQTNLLLSGKLKKMKVSAVAAAITTLICNSVPSYASDAEIYVVPANKVGATTLMMMLDISGSMDACDQPSNVSSTTRTDIATVSHNGFTTTYTQNYCANQTTQRRYYYMRTGSGTSSKPYVYYKCSSTLSPDYTTVKNTANCTAAWGSQPSGYSTENTNPSYYYKNANIDTTDRYYWRITRVQNAMMAMLNGDATTTKLADDLVIGLSTLGRKYSSSTDTGQVLIPARALSTVIDTTTGKTQRDLLIETVATFGAVSYTPTARSYAETAAYLLGTHTKHNSDTTSETINGVNTTYPYGSGFLFSDPSTKTADGNSYAAPSSITAQIGSTTAARNARECSGQGIYVLTDGLPNNQNYAQSLMRTALGQSATSSSASNFRCNVGDTWDCIRKFAQILKNPTQNSAGLEFRTAVVGFGAENFPADAQAWGQEGGGGIMLAIMHRMWSIVLKTS